MMLLSMMLGMFSTSCQDMLTPDSERHAYTVAEDTLYSYWGILRSLQNIAERYVILNECRGDLVDETSFVSDTIGAIVNFGNVSDPEKWKDGACAYLNISDYYHIINSCNAYIAMCDTTRTTGTNQSYMVKELAQVHSIRAWVYMQLLYAYGPNRIPFYKEPMLTTDDINNFVANKGKTLLNAQVLADELGPDLEVLEKYELDSEYGLPGYNNYGDVSSGNSHFVCHSSKCMFPIPIVLGDLYLLSGDYAKSATHYFEYIKSDKCGSLLVGKYRCRGDLDDKVDYPLYRYDADGGTTASIANTPYRETGAVSRTTESITCIPSNKGKLEGKVLTDISRLFGFEASLRTNVGTESSSSSVDLSRNYERELIPSRGYEALCDSQKYEVYVATTSGTTVTIESLEELPGVGDARRAWIYAKDGEQWTFRVGDNNFYGKMVSKQNPGQNFSTVYPVIYRKSTVWLRYAEAVNRAGFPGYAFAILKTGLCNNSQWFPENPKETYNNLMNNKNGLGLTSVGFDYIVTDSLLYYVDDVTGTTLPEGWQTNNQIHHLDELRTWLTAYFQAEYDASQLTDEPMTEPRTIVEDNILWIPAGEDVFSNTPNIAYRSCACYFLDRREVERAGNTPYMDFKQVRGQSQSQIINFKEQGKLYNKTVYSLGYPSDTDPSILYTIGVHQRGCGTILFDDPAQYRSSYTYVNMVQKKIKEATGLDVTEDDIYSGNYDAQVQDAVEDLIIDEMGLELAFEGSRFSDLYRVAARRNNPDYLAERVAKRHTGEVDPNLRSWLNDKTHWFLPIPQE